MKYRPKIKPPKYRVGRYVLNEYELRSLMVSVAKGEIDDIIIVSDINGNMATILPSGRLDGTLYGLDINSKFTLELLKNDRIKNNNAKTV
jgi:hypothetical protein